MGVRVGVCLGLCVCFVITFTSYVVLCRHDWSGVEGGEWRRGCFGPALNGSGFGPRHRLVLSTRYVHGILPDSGSSTRCGGGKARCGCPRKQRFSSRLRSQHAILVQSSAHSSHSEATSPQTLQPNLCPTPWTQLIFPVETQHLFPSGSAGAGRGRGVCAPPAPRELLPRRSPAAGEAGIRLRWRSPASGTLRSGCQVVRPGGARGGRASGKAKMGAVGVDEGGGDGLMRWLSLGSPEAC